MPGVADDEQARAVLTRLDDPAGLVAEAAADLHPAAVTTGGPSGAEIVALVLMGIGGVLLGPAAALYAGSRPRPGNGTAHA